MNNQAATPTAAAPGLLEQVRNAMRLHHYSIHTERTYVEWIKRYVQFHHRRCREDLAGGEAKIEAFPTNWAVRGKVAPATQNQTMNALVFLSQHVWEVPLDQAIDAVRAERKVNMPVVLTREAVASSLDDLQGSVWRRLRERPNRRHAFPSCYATCIRGNHRPIMGMMGSSRKLFPQRFFELRRRDKILHLSSTGSEWGPGILNFVRLSGTNPLPLCWWSVRAGCPRSRPVPQRVPLS